MSRSVKKSNDVGALIYAGKKFPCLCGRPGEDGPHVDGRNVTTFRDRAGLVIAHVECPLCEKKWKRVGS